MERCSDVFERNGFTGATLTQMVVASGFTRGAFYFHFESKDALAEAIVDDQAARWVDLFERMRAVEPDPLRALLRFAYASAAVYQSDIVVRAASRLINERVLIARQLPATYPWWVATVHHLLTESAAAGLLSPDADRLGGGTRGLDTLAGYLVASWHGTQQQAAAGTADLPGQMRAGWQIVLSAISRDPEPKRSMLALNDELDLAMRTHPESIIPPALPDGDD
jgi:AcrR family transcriptional regulator